MRIKAVNSISSGNLKNTPKGSLLDGILWTPYRGNQQQMMQLDGPVSRLFINKACG